MPFADYAEDELVGEALSNLSGLTDFRGPKDGGQVTPGTLFRSGFSGVSTGPYVSQFVYRIVLFGALSVEQLYQVPVTGDDFMTSYDEWLAIQNGDAPSAEITFDPTLRYLRNGRDLSYLVHGLARAQLALSAALILLKYEDRSLIPDGSYYGNENRPASPPSATPTSSTWSCAYTTTPSKPRGTRSSSFTAG